MGDLYLNIGTMSVPDLWGMHPSGDKYPRKASQEYECYLHYGAGTGAAPETPAIERCQDLDKADVQLPSLPFSGNGRATS